MAPFPGHLENISDNMLMGAVNAFNGETNKVWNRSTNTYGTVSGTAKLYKSEGILPLSLPKRIMVKGPAVSMLPWNHAS